MREAKDRSGADDDISGEESESNRPTFLPKGSEAEEHDPSNSVDGDSGPRDPRAPEVPLEDPQAKHERDLERRRLIFGFWLVGLTVLGAVALSVLEYFLPGYEEGSSLSSAVSLMQAMATTALGFVFGRTLPRNGES